MSNLILSLILPILEKFRFENPRTWLYVMLFIGSLNYALVYLQDNNVLAAGSFWVTVTQWVSVIYAFLSSVKTDAKSALEEVKDVLGSR